MTLTPNQLNGEKIVTHNSCKIINDKTGVFSYIFRSIHSALQITGKNVGVFRSGTEDEKQIHWLRILQYALESNSSSITVDAAPIIRDLNLQMQAPSNQLKLIIQTLPPSLVTYLFGIEHHCNSCQKTDTYQTINKSTTLHKKCQHCQSPQTHITNLPLLLLFYPQCLQLGVKLNINQQMFYLNSFLTAHNSMNNCFGVHLDLSTTVQEEFLLSCMSEGMTENQVQYLKPDVVRQYLLTSDTGYNGSNPLFNQIGMPQLCIYVNSSNLPDMIRKKVDVSLTLRGTAVDTVVVTPMKNQRFSDPSQNTLPVIASLTPGLYSAGKTIPTVPQSQLPSTRPTSNLYGTPQLKRIDDFNQTNDMPSTPVIMTNPQVNLTPQLKSGNRPNISQTITGTSQKQNYYTGNYGNMYVCTIGWLYWLFFGLSCAMMLIVCVLMGIHQGRLNGTITMNNVTMNEAMLVGLQNVRNIAGARQFILQADVIAGQTPQPLQTNNEIKRLNAVANAFTTYTNFLSVGNANSANIEFHSISSYDNVSCLDTTLNVPGTVIIGNYTPSSITAQSITAKNVLTSDFVNANTSMTYPSVASLTAQQVNAQSFESNAVNITSGTAGSINVTKDLTATNLVSQNTNASNYTVLNNLTTTTGSLNYNQGTIQGPTIANNTFIARGQGNPSGQLSSNIVFERILLQNNGAMRFSGNVNAQSLTCTGQTLIVNGTLSTPTATISTLQGNASAQTTNAPTLTAQSVTCNTLNTQTLNGGSLTAKTLNSGSTTLSSLTSTFIEFDDQQFTTNQLNANVTGPAGTGQYTFGPDLISGNNLAVNGLTGAGTVTYNPGTQQVTVDSASGGPITAGSVNAPTITANSYTGQAFTATGQTTVNQQFSANSITAGNFAILNGTQVFSQNGVSVDYMGSATVCQGGNGNMNFVQPC